MPTVDEYLATLPQDARAALEKVRKAVKSAAPAAVEGFGYGMPAYKYRGRPLAYFAAFKNHCSFFPASGAVIASLADELKAYDVDKGTIRFPVEKPLSAAVVRKMIRARMQEIDAKLDA